MGFGKVYGADNGLCTSTQASQGAHTVVSAANGRCTHTKHNKLQHPSQFQSFYHHGVTKKPLGLRESRILGKQVWDWNHARCSTQDVRTRAPVQQREFGFRALPSEMEGHSYTSALKETNPFLENEPESILPTRDDTWHKGPWSRGCYNKAGSGRLCSPTNGRPALRLFGWMSPPGLRGVDSH